MADTAEHQFFCVAVTPDYRILNTWSLVLLAADIPHRIERRERSWMIFVEMERARQAEEELAAFTQENADWPPVEARGSDGRPAARHRQPPTVLMMGLLILFYVITGPWSWHSEWFEKGAISLTAVMQHGEWWRLFTSLTLHADEVHLLGNVLIGGLMVHFLCLEIGAGLGWLLLLAAGGAGNYCNLLWRYGEHLSVGFSTAVFGAIGILCGLAVRRWSRPGDFLVPLGAGLALLAFIGSSGKHTDLGAHLWGLVCGFGMGMLLSLARPLLQRVSERVLNLLLPLCLLFLVGCWVLAMR